MKKLTTILSFVCITVFAGTETPETAPAPWYGNGTDLLQTLMAAHSASIAVYPSYDPYIKVGGVSKPFGFGMALLYPVSDYAFVGGRVDFLGNSFWAPSAVVGAKYTLDKLPLKPTVFTVAGIIMPLGGAGAQNNVAGAITGLGATATLYKSKDDTFSVNAFIEGEKWTNFEGVIVHPGIAGALKF